MDTVSGHRGARETCVRILSDVVFMPKETEEGGFIQHQQMAAFTCFLIQQAHSCGTIGVRLTLHFTLVWVCMQGLTSI